MGQNIETTLTRLPWYIKTKEILLPSCSLISVITGAVIVFGLWEVLIGWQQLLGFRTSLHNLYPVTGSFFNPGPYCLFLAVVCPLALSNLLKEKRGFFHWEGIIYLISALPLMPSLMGRTGWIAALAGMTVTLISLPAISLKLSKHLVLYICMALICGGIVAYLLFSFKSASALGRILIWTTGWKAMFINPLTGVGWQNVAGALGTAQEQYFVLNPDSIFAGVAGSPDSPFNEFLRIGIAFGIPVLLLFILMMAYAVYSAWKGKQYGVAGSLVGINIGCLASYPFKFPEFVILTGILIITALLSNATGKFQNILNRFLSFGIMVIAILSLAALREIGRLDNEWNMKRYAYQYSLSEQSILYIDSLFEHQNKNPQFLFDYGKSLRESGFQEKSNEVLQRGLNVSSDPMFLNLIGRNYHDLGKPELAEKYYQRSINRLPGRFYPYYLLCKLYADPRYENRTKFLDTYNKLLKMEPKVMSPAIKEMREEIKDMFENMQNRKPN